MLVISMQIFGSFTLCHTWGNAYISLGYYFEFYFTVADVRNLDANLWGYFELFFIIKKVANLDTNFWGYSKLIFRDLLQYL
jgi:hypothetical protein